MMTRKEQADAIRQFGERIGYEPQVRATLLVLAGAVLFPEDLDSLAKCVERWTRDVGMPLARERVIAARNRGQ